MQDLGSFFINLDYWSPRVSNLGKYVKRKKKSCMWSDVNGWVGTDTTHLPVTFKENLYSAHKIWLCLPCPHYGSAWFSPHILNFLKVANYRGLSMLFPIPMGQHSGLAIVHSGTQHHWWKGSGREGMFHINQLVLWAPVVDGIGNSSGQLHG